MTYLHIPASSKHAPTTKHFRNGPILHAKPRKRMNPLYALSLNLVKLLAVTLALVWPYFFLR